MSYDTKNDGLDIELVIRTRGYSITLDARSGDVIVRREPGEGWQLALRRRRCTT